MKKILEAGFRNPGLTGITGWEDRTQEAYHHQIVFPNRAIFVEFSLSLSHSLSLSLCSVSFCSDRNFRWAMAQERWQVNDSELSAATSSSSSSSAPKTPIPCVNNCGFFGTAAQMDYCSACYRKMSIHKPDQTLDHLDSSFVPPPPSGKGSMVAVTLEIEGSAAPLPKNGENKNEILTKSSPSSRCQSCRKRLGLSGFKCRCGDLFCPLHRYSDKHDCTFDYKAAARTQISRSNPLVVAAKITKI